MDYDEWFIREVEKGLTSADRGEFLMHDEVGTRLEKLMAEKVHAESLGGEMRAIDTKSFQTLNRLLILPR